MRNLWPYVLGLDAIALVVLEHSLRNLTLRDVYLGLVVAVIYTLVELYPLNLNEEGDLTVGESVQIATLLFLGIHVTLIGVIAGEFAYGIIKHRPLIKTFFNAGQSVMASALANYTFMLTGGDHKQLSAHALVIPLVFVIVNSLLVAWILSLYQRQSLWRTWTGLNRDTIAYTTILGISGLAFGGLLLSYDWLGLGLVLVMLVCLWAVLSQASYNLRNMKVQFMQTVRVLMTALEYRDPYTYGHSGRVAIWCRKIAQEMGLSMQEIELIELGGLMHDVGKVGVPDVILNKPTRLNEEEFEKIKAHPLIGERILLEMERMEYVAAMARQHHLFYDGDAKGYPEDVLDEEKYVGSRILSVADSWDAMTSDRPYRKALSVEQAVSQLVAGKGTQFDPEVVDAFLRVLQKEGILLTSSVASPARDVNAKRYSQVETC